MKILTSIKTLFLILLILSKLFIVAACFWGLFAWLFYVFPAHSAYLYETEGGAVLFGLVMLFGFWLLYSIFSTFCLLKTKRLFISGAILQVLLLYCTYSEYQIHEDLALHALKIFGYYSFFWWLHLLLTYTYQDFPES